MTRQIQWRSADGQTTTLTDRVAGYRVLADGTAGLNAPSYLFSTSQFAGQDGVHIDAITAGPREVSLGMLIQAANKADLHVRTVALTRAMRPKAGPGQLIVSSDDGRARILDCHYRAGMEGSEARGTKVPGRWWKFVLQLTAYGDPWFRGETRTLSVGLGASTSFFPIFPLRLASSTVQGQFTVDLSDTDTPTPPVWTITGPGTSLVLTNHSTGKVIEVNASIGSGEIMVIDTRPGQQSVRLGDGTNLMTYVASDPALWMLQDGVNEITAALAGATEESRISGAYTPRYSGV